MVDADFLPQHGSESHFGSPPLLVECALGLVSRAALISSLSTPLDKTPVMAAALVSAFFVRRGLVRTRTAGSWAHRVGITWTGKPPSGGNHPAGAPRH